MFDILLFLFTVFFVYKLKNSFGKRTDDDENRKKSIEEFFKQKYSENSDANNNSKVIDITNKVQGYGEIDLKSEFELSDDVKLKLSTINFDRENFLKGVESAIEMISDAFSNKDLDTLKNLLSTNIFNDFKEKIDNLTKQNMILKSSIISVQFKNIDDITVKDNKIFIDVSLKMEQINFIENNNKQVIAGDKKRIDIVKEKWTFERNVNSKENFWVVNNITNIE